MIGPDFKTLSRSPLGVDYERGVNEGHPLGTLHIYKLQIGIILLDFFPVYSPLMVGDIDSLDSYRGVIWFMGPRLACTENE